MIRKLPLIPTLVVALAAATMVGLGFWQLSRADEKNALVERYARATELAPIAFPTIPTGEDLPLFRRATGNCLEVVNRRVTAGQNESGEPGYVHIADCRTGAEGPGMAVQIGWSRNPRAAPEWRGGPVSGIIAPDREMRLRLVADRPAEGLSANATPSVRSIPNNHLMYAVQWFVFAGLAILIYGLALRRRRKESGQ